MTRPAQGDPFPDFQIHNFDTKAARGDAMLLVICWSLQSDTCRWALPYWQRLAEANPRADILGVCLDDEDEMDAWCRENSIRFRQLAAPEHELAKGFSWDGLPAYWLTDAAGTVLASGSGWDRKQFEDINRTLAAWQGLSARELVRTIDDAPEQCTDPPRIDLR